MRFRILGPLLKRTLASLVVLFLLISFVFILLRLSPGDPSQKYISPELTPELTEKVRESFDLNNSVFDQYKSFVVNIFQGDFGISYDYRIPVIEVIKEYLPFTILLALTSLIIQLFAGIFFAVISSKKPGSFIDKFVNRLSLVIYAVPSFALGVMLLYLFSETFQIFPSSGISSIGSEDWNFWQKFIDYLSHMILPLATLSFAGIAVFYKYMRDNIDAVRKSNFILNLRAQGMHESKIKRRHIIPNAIGPLISIAGIELGFLLSGALITEVIFGLPGMGRLTINSILSRDYPVVIGCTLTAGVLVIISNLFADLFRAGLDKRVMEEII